MVAIRSRIVVMGVVALVVAAGIAATIPQASAQADNQRFQRGAAPQVLTLVTGDRVSVVSGRVAVSPAPGREKVQFVAHRVDGHIHVIPLDALPLLPRREVALELAAVAGGHAVVVIAGHRHAR